VETKNVLTVPLSAGSRQFFDRLTAQVRSLPGVQAVTISEGLPALQRGIVTVADAIDSPGSSSAVAL
jgi:hypothetical protein